MRYWLFKTEPDEFSIQMLANSPNHTARWDGIRNYQARNTLRDQIQPLDRLFIYHSGIKQAGIVGIAQIATPSYPDPAQFNPDSTYFDAKSTLEKPRWFCTDIRWLATFTATIPLTWIKQTAALHTMALLKQSRLSVQPVSQAEWDYIMQQPQAKTIQP